MNLTTKLLNVLVYVGIGLEKNIVFWGGYLFSGRALTGKRSYILRQ